MNDEATRRLVLRGCYGNGHRISQGNSTNSIKIKVVNKLLIKKAGRLVHKYECLSLTPEPMLRTQMYGRYRQVDPIPGIHSLSQKTY